MLDFCQQIIDNFMYTERRFWGYTIGIAQIDDKIREKLNFQKFPDSTVNLILLQVWHAQHTLFFDWWKKNQLDAILESFGTTEEIKISLTRLPSTTYSLPRSTCSPNDLIGCHPELQGHVIIRVQKPSARPKNSVARQNSPAQFHEGKLFSTSSSIPNFSYLNLLFITS